ncbi:hypothetical protein A9Q84_04305 [Halobacteriovorax marinus]|uniref:Uncharacterized protein n=1 Tax=Halobacteriovorax marinus TaxID=97084 RepID=A0A1Y5FH41_9BACT|nr:hypothetical protein A9Q84_04305 [Halobacteriovorax marinus]
MEHGNYNKFNRPKFNKAGIFSDDFESFQSLENLLLDLEKGNIFDTSDIYKSYCFELKSILKSDDVKESLENFFKVENQLEKLESMFEFEGAVPNLLDFHRNFSPTVLRAFWESISANEFESLPVKLLEAFRIAIEEELYIWQEKKH